MGMCVFLFFPLLSPSEVNSHTKVPVFEQGLQPCFETAPFLQVQVRQASDIPKNFYWRRVPRRVHRIGCCSSWPLSRTRAADFSAPVCVAPACAEHCRNPWSLFFWGALCAGYAE